MEDGVAMIAVFAPALPDEVHIISVLRETSVPFVLLTRNIHGESIGAKSTFSVPTTGDVARRDEKLSSLILTCG